MDLVFGLSLLVLAVAVVVLFAMFGELAARVGEPARWTGTRPLETARIGHRPANWPGDLGPIAVAEDALLLILSTACGSCQQVATQLSAVPDKRGTDNLAVLVSCANPVSGQSFIDHHGIGWIRHHVDTGGEWIRSEFGIDMSPVGLVLSGGRLEAAHVFEDVAAMTAEAAKHSVQRRQEGATT